MPSSLPGDTLYVLRTPYEVRYYTSASAIAKAILGGYGTEVEIYQRTVGGSAPLPSLTGKLTAEIAAAREVAWSPLEIQRPVLARLAAAIDMVVDTVTTSPPP